MKCTQAEQSILLAQSGELSWLGRRRLNGHTASCAACRAYRDELERLTALTRQADADLAAPAVPVTRLANRGRNYAVRFLPTREPWSVTFRPAFVYASISLMVMLALFLITRPYFRPVQVAVQQSQQVEEFDSAWTNGFDNQISELDSSLAMASWDSTAAETAESEDLNSVAGELLELEGQKI
jgi:hypothetical protein